MIGQEPGPVFADTQRAPRARRRYAEGNLSDTGIKSFVQPHPTDPAVNLRFVCLEGNESGTYFRGTGQLTVAASATSRPVIENRDFRPEERGVPFGTQYPAGLREILVQNGTLNPDFTPNEGRPPRGRPGSFFANPLAPRQGERGKTPFPLTPTPSGPRSVTHVPGQKCHPCARTKGDAS